jgi:dTDP-4-dehydrorhamnose reductase
MVKVVILGSTGMLGNAVAKTFLNNKNFETITSYRKESHKLNDNSFYFDATKDSFNNIPHCDYIINCIGIIKPYMKNNMISNVHVNSIFPHVLSQWCTNNGTKMIHITTDCVFSGDSGFYTEVSSHDCLDEYGKSKSLGEPSECMVLRTSIIGEEIHSFSSLISWVKSQNGKTISGYTNHMWNGMTTTQYAKCCIEIIEKNLYENGLFHIHSDDVTKYDLVKMIAEEFKLKLTINPKVVENSCNRTLRSLKNLNAKLTIDKIENQLKEIGKKT